ncbi:AraC family transcriptional regulator [Acinetobacter guerrae]|uniref:AraC family transcriptional regulator n=1 Tax=Acinetobacter guerrae TaxID=1843371 RepID=A0A3A8EH36_9GAMM|nr:AraC family transcriptional regulator [Acinetobacter guerrae]MPW45418.1 AraC family transcriptional regulator [Acinetobacter guerrae]RKG34262.1 AraC family transcriptional regulator [Acinetobacter guerrae]
MQTTFYHIKSVDSNLIRMLELFCIEHQVKFPDFMKNYANTERTPFSEWLLVLDYISQQCPIFALGVKIANFVKPEHLGILGYLSSTCENLGHVLSVFSKYNRLSYDFIEVHVGCVNNELMISWGGDSSFKASDLADELMVGVIFNLANKLIFPEKIKVNRIEFSSVTPKRVKFYEDYFDCTVQFNQSKTSIYLPLTNLNFKVPTHDAVLNNILHQQAENLLAELPKGNSFDEEVRRAIISAINQGKISIDYVAQQLGCSARIFQYKLKKKGYSFKQCLNEVRKELAIIYLGDASLSILDISLLLSYKEQTSFNRSFKSWMGVSPLQYRRKILNNFFEIEQESEWNILM